MKSFKFEMLYNLKLYGVFFLVLLTPSSRLIKYNHEYFGLSAVEYLLAVAFLSFALYLASFVLRLILGRERLFIFALLVLIASVVMVYFVPVQLAVIDGNEQVDFALREEAVYFLYLLPIFFLLVFFINRLRLYGLVKTISQFSALYVIAFAAYGLFSVDKYIGFTGSNKDYKLPLSSTENIFVISFDQVQGTLVAGILEDDPGQIQNVFRGFTFYSDAASTYPNTNYSLASVALGRVVNDSSENMNSSVDSSESFLSAVKLKGYDIYIGGAFSSEVFECLTCASGAKVKAGFNGYGVYEYLRHSMNLVAGVDIGEFVGGISLGFIERHKEALSLHAWKHDIGVFSNLVDGAYVNSDRPALFYMHFLGTHQPFTYNSDCSLKSDDEASVSQSPRAAVESFECMLASVEKLNLKLDEYGLYDESKIFIYSDHGYEAPLNKYYREASYKQYFNEYSSYVGEGNIKPVGAYNPILFYKESSSFSGFNVSRSPVSLVDIASTICGGISCEQAYPGLILGEDNIEERERDFWLYQGGADMRAQDGTHKFHDGLDIFWQKRSFKGPIYPGLANEMGLADADNEIRLNQRLVFDSSGKADGYLGVGWSGQESTHCWTDGSKATLQLPLDQSELNPNTALRLRMQANGFSPQGKDHQPVTVMVNDTEVAQWQLRGVEWHEAIISAEVAAKQWPLQVDFLIAEPTAPCDVSSSKDCRKLGMAARELVLEAVESGQ